MFPLTPWLASLLASPEGSVWDLNLYHALLFWAFFVGAWALVLTTYPAVRYIERTEHPSRWLLLLPALAGFWAGISAVLAFTL